MPVSSNGDVSQSAATVVSMASRVSSVYVTLSGSVAFDSLSACFLQEATVTAAMTTSNAKITGSRYFFFRFQSSLLIRLQKPIHTEHEGLIGKKSCKGVRLSGFQSD